MKIRSVGDELFHADRRTDRQAGRQQADRHDEADSRFPQFCERAYTLLILCRRKKKRCFLQESYRTCKDITPTTCRKCNVKPGLSNSWPNDSAVAFNLCKFVL